MKESFAPEFAITQVRSEFCEHGGVAPSVGRTSTFTVMEPGAMTDIFAGIVIDPSVELYINPGKLNAWILAGGKEESQP